MRNKRTTETSSRINDEEIKFEARQAKSERKIQSLKSEIERLKEVINQKERDSQDQEKYAELLSELYEKGIINTDGNFINSEN